MKKIIDVCCGGKMFWFDKQNADVVFCDNRSLSTNLCDGRNFEVKPDVVCDFTNLPFEDNSFYLAVFDPPHLPLLGEKSYMAIKYGILKTPWEDNLHKGFEECMRVLKPNGVLIFKWSETQIKVSEIIKIFGKQPLFGHKSGRLNKTHWLCFMKGV